MDKKLFSTEYSNVAATDTINRAGGSAYSLTPNNALAQLAVTGCFSNTYYTTGQDQLNELKNILPMCDSVFVAKTAVYAAENGKMKDMPVFLLAELYGRREYSLLRLTFNRVITTGKNLCNFIRVVRSGVCGRKNLNSTLTKLVNDWLNSRNSKALFNANIGQSNPSLGDVIKLSHPRPVDKEHDSVFGYLTGNDYNVYHLHEDIQQFEGLKLLDDATGYYTPDLNFRALVNLPLTAEHWIEIANNMPWNTLRMNLNMLARKGVFDNKNAVKTIAKKLKNPQKIKNSNIFPYQLLTAYQNTSGVPKEISLALQDAMEIATENVPDLGDVAVCIDLSGSMHSPVTGYTAKQSVTRCIDVATLIAACIARKNPYANVIGWATKVGEIQFNSRDSIMTNAKRFVDLSCEFGGGTNAALGLQYLNQHGYGGNVIYVSDNQSWLHRNAGMAREWNKYSRQNKNAKLLCVDLQPYTNTQVKDSPSVLNVGGWSDEVFNIADYWFNHGETDFSKIINSISLD